MSATVRVSPSLALIKYWGKADSENNLPATSSLAITLSDFYTETTLTLNAYEDTVRLNGISQDKERFLPFFDNIRNVFGVDTRFFADSCSNFPTAAGLASSSSGFAALALAAAKILDDACSLQTVSQLARVGSASAARAVFEGFTVLAKNSPSAKPLFDNSHWPELSLIIAQVSDQPKAVSSRSAMELARNTSPFYPVWVQESEAIFQQAVIACREKNLWAFGPLIRKSYLMMFSTMFTSEPPVLYWLEESVGIIKQVEYLRAQGFCCFETMDAGPQVKIVCLKGEEERILEHLTAAFPKISFLKTALGQGPRFL